MPTTEIDRLCERFRASRDDVLITALDNHDFTYGQFWANALRLCADWREKGLHPGANIAFTVPNDASVLCCYLACAIGGFVANPIPSTSTPQRIKAMMALMPPDLVVDAHPGLDATLPASTPVEMTIDGDPDRAFCVFYTSGTTGAPKGIVHRLSGMIGGARAFAKLARMDRETCVYHILPMAYMAGFLNTFLAPLMAGGRIVEGFAFSPLSLLRFWDRPAQFDINTLCLTPTIAAALCQAVRDPEKARACVAKIRSLQSTAGVLHRGVRQEFLTTFGRPLQDCYGLTELGGPLTLQTPQDAETLENSGMPMEELHLRFRPSPQGGDEVLIHSPFIMKGYLTPDGLEQPIDSQGYMATGDIAELENGNLHITGRCKDIIVRGEVNIAPIVIENVISPIRGVEDVAVVGADHEFWGEVAVACIVSSEDSDHIALEKLIIQRCADELSEPERPYKVLFMKDFPRSLTGKTQKIALRAQIASKLVKL